MRPSETLTRQLRWGLMFLSALIAMGTAVCRAEQPAGAVAKTAPASQEVEFRSGDVTLSGTLLVPPNMIAAVVVVHGSGKARRNILFAQALVRNGVATLTYDKRGVGKSAGMSAGLEVGTNNVEPRNLDLLAGDASAAVKDLERRITSPRTPVGPIGGSPAGWIVPLATARSPGVKFMILWSGPLVTTREQLRFQFLTDGKVDFWDHHSEMEVREHIRSDRDRYPFVATDPVDSLRKLSIPGLWLYGGRDVYIPVGLSIARLVVLAASGKPFEHHLFPCCGHNPPFPRALSASMDWLMKRVVEVRNGKPQDIPGG